MRIAKTLQAMMVLGGLEEATAQSTELGTCAVEPHAGAVHRHVGQFVGGHQFASSVPFMDCGSLGSHKSTSGSKRLTAPRRSANHEG